MGAYMVSTGVDGAEVASGGPGATLKPGKLNLNANNNYAYAA